jgi:hypothetical protein
LKDVTRNPLADQHRWKHLAHWHGDGFFLAQEEKAAATWP